MSDLKHQAMAAFQAGLAAADPEDAVHTALQKTPLPKPKGRLAALAIGKAALKMITPITGKANVALIDQEIRDHSQIMMIMIVLGPFDGSQDIVRGRVV